MVVAGRTDAGVHASGQVAHIDVDPARLARAGARGAPASPTRPLAGLLRRLAGLLPADVRVREVSRGADGFDARFSALRRHYRYRIGTAPWGIDPLDRVGVLARPRPLDADLDAAGGRRAARAARLRRVLPTPRGRHHDPRPAATSPSSAHGDQVVVDVTADAFCHSMVRSLVGVLIGVGEGRLEVDAPARLLAARSRTAAMPTAPPGGLTLIGVDYPPDAELASQGRRDQSGP